MPHRATDPIIAAASIVMALQTIVSRNIDPLHAAVITVGAPSAGKANNVIPALATLELSVRALDREVRATVERRIKALVAAPAESFGVKAQTDWKPGYAVLVNTPTETAFAREMAVELVGAERVTLQGPPLTGSEDFAFIVLQAAVHHAEHHDGMQLLGDHGVDRISAQMRRRQVVQQHRVDRIARPWRHGVLEAHVHLVGHAVRVRKLAIQPHAHATVAGIRAHHLHTNRCKSEDDAVISGIISGNGRDVREHRSHRRRIAGPKPQQVGVPSRAVRQVVPERDEHCILEDEAVGMGRDGQAIQRPLQRETDQYQVEVSTSGSWRLTRTH